MAQFNIETGPVKSGRSSIELPQISSLFKNDFPLIDILLLSVKERTVQVVNYDLRGDGRLQRNVTFKSSGAGEYVVILRMSPSLSLARSFNKLKLRQVSITEAVATFYPEQLLVRNRTYNALNPSSGPASCLDERLRMVNSTTQTPTAHQVVYQKYEPNNSPIKQFSIGSPFSMDAIEENRIWGYFSLIGKKRKDVANIVIRGFQDDAQVFEHGLSTCALETFMRLNPNDDVILESSSHLAHYIFSIPFFKLSGVNPLKKLTLVSVVIYKGLGLHSVSNETIVDPLVSPNITRGSWYGQLDTYDSSNATLARTGGDKWIVPQYASMFTSLLDMNPIWKVNDISKLNGGKFLGHSGHDLGIEADLRFSGSGYDFSVFGESSASWKPALEKISNLLLSIKNYYGFINYVLITREQQSQPDPVSNEIIWNINKKFILNRFNNRYFGADDKPKRYIDLYEPKGGGRSLLVHAKNHYEHIHLRYNENYSSEIIPEKPERTFDDLEFRFDEKGILKIRPIPGRDFRKTRVLWRLQEIKGYEDISMISEMGRWVRNTSRSFSYEDVKSKFANSKKTIMYLYVVLGDTQSGGCKEIELQIDLSESRFKASAGYQLLSTLIK